MKKRKIIMIASITSLFVVVATMIVVNRKLIEVVNNENVYNEKQTTQELKDEISGLLKKSEVAKYLPENISEVKTINYITENQKTDIYTDEESILEFSKIICNTYWNEKEDDNKYCYFAVEIRGKDTVTILELGARGKASLIKDNVRRSFNISDDAYVNIFGFKTPKYYLHKSELEVPASSKCYEAQKIALKGLNEDEIVNLQKTLYIEQQNLEYIISNKVLLLKEKTSLYWRQQTEDEVFTDPITGIKVDEGSGLVGIKQRVQEAIKVIKDEETKRGLEEFCNILQEGIDKHDISKCFEAHEILHDYTYWVINYPVGNLPVEPVDWSATKIYFGRILIND